MKSKTGKLKSFVSLIILFIGIFLVGFLISKNVEAATIPDSPDTFFYDETNTLNKATKKLVTDKNEVYKSTKQKPQVIVAVVKSTGDESIEQFANDLFRKWQIGQKDKDNGILILYAVNKGKRNVRIEVGYGLEGAVTDAQAGQILVANQDDLKSKDTDDINQGLQKSFNAVATLIDKEYGFKGDKNSLSDEELEEIEHPNRVALPIAIGVGLLIFVIIGIFGANRYVSGTKRYRDDGSSIPWWVYMYGNHDDDDDHHHFGGPGSFGGGGFGGGSGGGFSGGGGSSGGGGASI